jgi:hypothetical protein
MVNDVAYESLKIPGFIASMIMKVLSKQIQSKVHFDILKLKPAEFAKNCSVPCVFIIGKEDKLVYPKRVKEIFDSYLGKQKTLLYSEGDHSSEREAHILKQCNELILAELKRHSGQTRTQERSQIEFSNCVNHPRVREFGQTFLQNFEIAAKAGFDHRTGLYNENQGHFNFDHYLDESRNEHSTLRADYEHQTNGESAGRFGHQSNLNESDDELLEELTKLQLDGDNPKMSKKLYDTHLQDLSLFLEKNHL